MSVPSLMELPANRLGRQNTSAKSLAAPVPLPHAGEGSVVSRCATFIVSASRTSPRGQVGAGLPAMTTRRKLGERLVTQDAFHFPHRTLAMNLPPPPHGTHSGFREDAAKTPSPRTLRPAGLWALFCLLALGIYLGWPYLLPPAAVEASQEKKSQAGVFRPSREQWASLKVTTVKRLPFRSTLSTDGNIAYNEDATSQVFSPYTGRVCRLIARLGDVVEKGAPLMAVEAAELVQGQSDVATARATLDAARATEQRQHDLYTAGAAALKDWRQAQTDLATAEATTGAARGRLHILGKSDAEIDALEKSSTGTSVALVSAPIRGTVTQRQVSLGQFIQSAASGASTPLFGIGDLSTVWLMANVREGDAPALHVGQDAQVTVLALPGKIFKARIAWVGPGVDPATHRLPVRAVVQNPDGELKPQMFATFSIATSAAIEAPAVPQSALVFEGASTRAFVVAADGSIAAREVKIGRSHDGMAEVLSGLAVGEPVVSAGTLFIDRAVGSD